MASDDHFLFCPLGCLSFSLWPLINPLSFVHWVVCPSHYDLWWPLFRLSIGLSVLLFMASDDPVLFCPLGCLSFSLCPLMTPFFFVHWVVYPSLYDLWWPLSLFSIGFSALLLFMTFDDPFPFFALGCMPFFSLWPLMNPLPFVHWVLCSYFYALWWALSLFSIGLSVLLFMTSVEPFLFCSLGCLPFFSLWPLMTPLSFVHWVVCPLYDLWWPLSLLSIGLSILLFMACDDDFLFCPLGCLSFSLWPLMTPLFCPLGCLFFSLWPLMTPLSFVYWVVCPSLYDLWWPLSLWSIGLSVFPFMASDDPFLFGPLGCLSFSLWPLMTPFSFVHWIVCPSLYVLWWPLSLLSIGLSILLFMTFDDPFPFFPLGCLPFFSLWPLMNPLSFVHWVVCPSLYGLWWPLSLLSIGFSVLLLFMASDDPFLFFLFGLFVLLLFMASDEPFLFCSLGCMSFSLWPLMSPFSLSIGLSVLFMTSEDPFLFCPLGFLSFSLWPLMTTFSFVHWVVGPSSLYGLWWPISLLSIGLPALLLFMASDDPFLFCPLGCLSFSLWPLMSTFSFVHWVVCPSSLYGIWWTLSLLFIVLSVLLFYGLWWPLSLLSIWLSVFLFMTSDDPFLFCPLGCLSLSLWPLMTPFSFVHWDVCPSSLYGLWWPLSLFSIGFSVLLLFMASDDPSLFCPLGCLSFLWPLMTPFSFVHWVVCPSSLYGFWWTLFLLSIRLSILLFMASAEPFLFCP